MDKKRIAKYWKVHSDNSLECTLCPHHCKIGEGHYGRCGVRLNQDQILYTTSYGKVVSYAYDPIEKKPLARFESGSTVFSIGTSGCNFNCKFCQNHELVHFKGSCRQTTPSEAINMAMQNGSIGIAYTYNEPTIWFEYVLDCCKLAKQYGLVNVLVTNGYIEEAPLLELLPYIDAMNIDLKSYSDDFYRELCDGHLSPVLNTISKCIGQTHVELTFLLIDGQNTNPEMLESAFKWVGELNRDIPVHISRYFPAYQMTVPKTRLDTLAMARDLAEKYLNYVYIGNAFL
jgi:pyruvate formate lyase activating enzyme